MFTMYFSIPEKYKIYYKLTSVVFGLLLSPNPCINTQQYTATFTHEMLKKLKEKIFSPSLQPT